MRNRLCWAFLLFALLFTACKTGELLSTTNQPEKVPRKITATSVTTEEKPDGTVVTIENKSVSVPLDKNGVEIITEEPEITMVYKSKDTVKVKGQQQFEETSKESPKVVSSPESKKEVTSEDFLLPRERAMVNEINLVRINPRAYIPFIEDYKNRYATTYRGNEDLIEKELAAANELIKQLSSAKPIPTLVANQKLYEVAKSHGQVIKKRNYAGHIGMDGSYPWERISRADPQFGGGAENLIAGLSSVRDAVIVLLVDAKVPNRGHRKVILEPGYKFVACYEIGEVNGTPFNWIQNFATQEIKKVAQAPEVNTEENEEAEEFEMPSFVVQGPEYEPATNKKPAWETDNTAVPSSVKNEAPADISNLFTIAEERAIDTGRRAAYLSEEEKSMIKEINRVRLFPDRYALIVQDYINSISVIANSEPSLIARIERGDDLIQELKTTRPMGMLEPYIAVQRAGKNHGEELQATENLTEVGEDGAYPWDRLSREDPKLVNGEENIFYGYKDVREAVIVTLLDISDRDLSEKKPLLDPQWTHIGINKYEKIGKVPYVWIQTFARMRGTASTPGKPTGIIPTNTNSNTNTSSNSNSSSTPANTTPKPTPAAPKTSTPQPFSNPQGTPPAYNVLPEEKPYDSGRGESYLSSREKEMIYEINRVRANPKRYVRFIQEYKENFIRINGTKTAKAQQELVAIDDLIQKLNTMKPVSILQPNESVYNSAKKHGEAARQRGRMGHIGEDGSYPWDRIVREDPSLSDGNENLISGPEGVREALILLLVDADFENRGHRHHILRDDWKYVAVYDAGQVGSSKNNWIQNFAK